MENDDEAARKERAESLRQRIRDLTSPDIESEAEATSKAETEHAELVEDEPRADPAPSGQNLRELIHRRMRELDKDKR